MGNKVSLEEELINLRITAKQMQRSAKKCESSEKAALDKLKKVSSELRSLGGVGSLKAVKRHPEECAAGVIYRVWIKGSHLALP
jgi:hypothetical protein